MDSLKNNNIRNLIKFQRNYRFIKNELNDLSNEILFMKECLIDMSYNLLQLNRMKIYDNTTYGYSNIYDELYIIKNMLDKFPDKISFKYLKNNNMDINDISNNVYCIKKTMIQYINHISPHSMNLVLKILFGKEWINMFEKTDIERLNLLLRLFNPINIWHSSYHNKPINYYVKNKEDRVILSKNIIDNIIESKDEKVQSIIIGNTNSFPTFLKSITEILTKDKRNIKQERKKDFNYIDLLGFFIDHNNIVFIKTPTPISLIEEKQGFMVLIKQNDNIVAIQGIVKDDIFELYKSNSMIASKIQEIKEYVNTTLHNIPNTFKSNYINILNICDIMVHSNEEISNTIKKRYNDYSVIQKNTLGVMINEFLLSSKSRKIEILTLFLVGNTYDCKLGFLLYDILKMKDKSDITKEIYSSLHVSLKIKLDCTETMIKEDEENILKYTGDELSYERRINMLIVSDNIKNKAIEKLKVTKNNFQGDNKAQTWLDGFFKIPFGIYCDNQIMSFKKTYIDEIKRVYPNIISINDMYSSNNINKILQNSMIDSKYKIQWDKYNTDRSLYLKDVKIKLDRAVYGHKEAKLQLERLFAQWINGETKGAIIGLWGPPGTGKTSLAKNGISQCLIDNNNKPRPFGFLPIGGSVNGSTLVGHNYTYVGSTWGRIVDILMTAGCMNPIIFIDEVDKISNTEYGKEISSILTHLTDLTQNDSFEDKYFNGIPLDLSKALIIFSFNDINMIDPILKDRINIIETKPYTLIEKIDIIQQYILPEILKDVGFNMNEIVFTKEIITYMIDTFTNEAGVRKIKEKLIDIVRDINLNIIHNNNNNIIPLNVTKEYIDNLFKNKMKIRITPIHREPSVGLVNGLYATTTGVGGLTVIQVLKYPSDKMMDLTITGQQGEVMKESVEYAMKIAYSLLPDETKNMILKDSKNKKNFGLHIHTPDAGTKKEGPSAGAAMTLAIYSVLTGMKVNNTIALTGEIDLWRNVKAIGGVYAKLYGAKLAGVKTVLIPKENEDDIMILRNENISPEDDEFKVILVDSIDDVIRHCIVL